jgi:hypothetical protein
MALTDESMVMPVSPMGGYGNGGFGGDWGSWIILFLIFGMFGGGFGNGGFAGNDFPWLMNGQNNINANTNNGFQNAAIQSAIGDLRTGVTAGFGDVALGIAGINQNICQTGNVIGNQIYGLSSQLSQCCCENRLATAQTQNVVQSEGAATRLAIQNQTQQIIDKMCQQEIDNLKTQNLSLQNQVNMQALMASQTAQTAALVADNTAQTQYIVNRVAPYPIPAYVVANPVTPAIA